MSPSAVNSRELCTTSYSYCGTKFDKDDANNHCLEKCWAKLQNEHSQEQSYGCDSSVEDFKRLSGRDPCMIVHIKK